MDYLKLTMLDVFELAVLGCEEELKTEPEIKDCVLTKISEMRKVYEDVVSDEMRALRRMSFYRRSGRKRSLDNKACPFCGSSLNVRKIGFDKKENQRYQCITCRKSFK